MWPFFSSGYTSARINKVLVEIEMEQQPIPVPQQPNSEQEPSAVGNQQFENDEADSDSDEEDRSLGVKETLVPKKELNLGLLEKLIDQPNLVQEIQQGKNAKLSSYISQDDVLAVLIKYLVESVPVFEDLYWTKQNESGTPVPQVEDQDKRDEYELDEEDDLEELPYGKETPEEKYLRRATTAGEILAVLEPSVISQRLLLPITDKDAIKSNEVSHFQLLSTLWNGIMESNLHVEVIVNVNLFVNIIENLIKSNINEFMNFIRQNQENHQIVDQIIKNAEISPILDLLIKIISLDKLDNPIGLIDILSEQKLIIRLLDLLDSDSMFLQNSIGDFLTNLISISANTPALYDADPHMVMDSPVIGPQDLSRSLVSEESIIKIIDIILKGGPCLTICVSLIIEIIRKNNSDYDVIDVTDEDFTTNPPSNRDPIFIGWMLKLFSSKLCKIFNKFFDKNYKVRIMDTPIGPSEPVGFERFKTIELIAELLHCSNMVLINNVNAESIILKRENFKSQKIELMNDALLDNLIGESNFDLDLESKFKQSRERSNSNETFHTFKSGTGGLGGGDGSTSLVDLEKLTSDIQSFSVNGGPSRKDESSEIEIEKPADVSIGDFFKSQLINGNMLIQIFSMLKEFPWNNFLHNVIFDIAQQVLNGKYDETNSNKDLILDIFSKDRCYLTKYIVDCYEYSSFKENEDNLRLGYMGHLILISEELVKFSSKVYAAVEDGSTLILDESTLTEETVKQMIALNDEIHDIISEPFWLDFVNNELVTIRDMYNQVLGGFTPDESNTYINPNAILLGNGDDQDEEAIEEDYGVDAVDPLDENTEILDSQEISENSVDDLVQEVDDEAFSEELYPVSKHSSDE